MPRQDFDKSSKYMVQHHGQALLLLGGARGVRQWRALQAELVQPRRLPDGLLEVYFQGRDKPDYVLVEVATYPEKRAIEQATNDLGLARVHLGVLPEMLMLVLRPRGQFRIAGQNEEASRLGWSRLGCGWRVVELWNESAEHLLTAGSAGLVPWATLANFDGPPEMLLERCRQEIERLAPRDEQTNLLAVSPVLARLRFPDPDLLALLGGERVMIESPLIKELLAKQDREAIQEVLSARFGTVPQEIARRVRGIKSLKRLKELIRAAAQCPDLDAFRERLLA